MFHPLTQHLGAVSTSPHMPIFRGQSGHMLVQYLGTCRIHLRGVCLRLDLIDFDCQRPHFDTADLQCLFVIALDVYRCMQIRIAFCDRSSKVYRERSDCRPEAGSENL